MLAQTARKAFVATLVAGGVIVLGLALWKLKLVISLVFLGFIVAAAMRPSVDALRRGGIPRGIGIAIHYLALAGLVALFLWLLVPRAVTQVQNALGSDQLTHATQTSTGIKHELLVGLQKRLDRLPSGSKLIKPAAEVTKRAFEVVLGIFFTLATAAYWIFERDRCMNLVASLVPRQKRKRLRDTWNLIDLKLGAFVRGQALLIVLVGTVLSVAFWAIGLRYWLLVGSFAGIVEMVPVLGPLTAGALAVGVGLTQSWHVALAAGITVLCVRLLEDYLVLPKVLGDATGLSPLVVLFSVSAVTILFGGFAVLMAVPLAAVLATIVDVAVRGRDPADEEVPTVLFPAKDAEG
ncbi:MAG TPA: AI-2E family transporter [Gaiellaceae bacterium]